MKTQSRTSRVITGAAVICALGIATTASAKKPKEVTLEISNNQLIMKTNKGDNDCKATLGEYRKAGCIQLKKNENSEILVHLIGETKCTLESGKNWKLNAIYLGGFNSRSKPTGAYGFTSNANYNKVNSDFNGVDKASGLVNSAVIRDKKITIDDKNGYKDAYHVWYKIEAVCEREDGKTAHITSYDPRIKNGGNE